MLVIQTATNDNMNFRFFTFDWANVECDRVNIFQMTQQLSNIRHRCYIKTQKQTLKFSGNGI